MYGWCYGRLRLLPCSITVLAALCSATISIIVYIAQVSIRPGTRHSKRAVGGPIQRRCSMGFEASMLDEVKLVLGVFDFVPGHSSGVSTRMARASS